MLQRKPLWQTNSQPPGKPTMTMTRYVHIMYIYIYTRIICMFFSIYIYICIEKTDFSRQRAVKVPELEGIWKPVRNQGASSDGWRNDRSLRVIQRQF